MEIKYKKSIVTGIVAFFAFSAFVAGSIWGIYGFVKKDLPSAEEVETFEPFSPTKLLDIKNRVICEFYEEKRIQVDIDDIPVFLKVSFIVVEDKRFFSHWGVSIPDMTRALLVNIFSGRIAQGASTITQQLARNMFLSQEKTILRKIKEIFLAIEIEKVYTKEEILEMYLNQVYFGHGAYGVEAASQLYFGKSVKDLDPVEAATIAAIAKGPSYSPFRNPERTRVRRNVFLKALKDNHYLTKAEYEKYKKSSIILAQRKTRKINAPYFSEEVRKYLSKKYGADFVYRSGSVVYTTLDLDLQMAAESLFEKRMLEYEKKFNLKVRKYDYDTASVLDTINPPKYLQGAVVLLDVATGEVRTLIGGRDFVQSKFNRAIQAKRQPGSSFKVFLYTAAIDNGFTSADIVVDAPIRISIPGYGVYSPANFDRKFMGPITIRTAIKYSRNLAAVRLNRVLGPELVIEYAYKMGITSPLKAVYSLPLGVNDVSPIEMARAFSTLSNEGIKVTPYFIRKVVDRYGRVVEEKNPHREEVLSPQTSYVLIDLMKSVVNEGTAKSIRRVGYKGAAAGKTGTTNNFTDAWFVGFTPELCMAVWVGFDSKQKINRGAQGGSVAAPIWGEIMKSACDLGYNKVNDFDIPDGIVYREICLETGKIATPYCPVTKKEVFINGTEPTEECYYHKFFHLHRMEDEQYFYKIDRDNL